MQLVNVGIVGVGNCASSLVQGIEYYRDSSQAGLTNPICVGYSVADVQVTAAFDVHRSKIGLDLAEAIWVAPNNALKFSDVPRLGVTVREGILADGIGFTIGDHFDATGNATLDEVVAHLQATNTKVLVNFLPTGSQQASELYADAALRAECAFVNCIPTTIARSTEWDTRFEAAKLPLIGDDLKSQFGATLVHRALVDVLTANGVVLRNTYQLLSGGNMDFLNLQDPANMRTKQETKTAGLLGTNKAGVQAHVSASYIPFLADRKIAMIHLEGEAFGGTPFELDLKMSVEDSPSAAGNVLDAVRYARFALDHGLGGVLVPVTALLMKASPYPLDDASARAALESWLRP